MNLIGHTTTQSGLAIRSELDENSYPTGQPVTAEQMESLFAQAGQVSRRLELQS